MKLAKVLFVEVSLVASSIDQVNPLLAMSQASGIAQQQAGQSISFENYLRAVNDRISEKENKLISDYKAQMVNIPKPLRDFSRENSASIERPKSYSERNGLGERSSSVVDNNRSSFSIDDNRKNNINDDSGYKPVEYASSVQTNRQNPYAQDNPKTQNNNSTAADRASSTERPAKDIILDPKPIPNNSQAVSGEELIAAITTNQSNDIASEDNFVLASLVYKLFALMNTSATGEGDASAADSSAESTEGVKPKSMKELMDMVSLLPKSEVDKLVKLLNAEELGISEKDKANLEEIKNILSGKQVADSTLATDKLAADKKIAEDAATAKLLQSNIDAASEEDSARSGSRVLDQFAARNIDTKNNVDNIFAAQDADKAVKGVTEDLGVISQLVEDLRTDKIKELLRMLREKEATEKATKEANAAGVATETTNTETPLISDVKPTLSNTTDMLAPANNLSTLDKDMLDKMKQLMELGLSDEEIIAIMKSSKEESDVAVFLGDKTDDVSDRVKVLTGETVKKANYDEIKAAMFAKAPEKTVMLDQMLENAIESSKQRVKDSKEATSQQAVEVKPQLVKQEVPFDATKLYESLKNQVDKIVKSEVAASSGSSTDTGTNSSNQNSQQGEQKNLLTSDLGKVLSSSANSASKSDSMSTDFNSLLKQQNDVKSEIKESTSLTSPKQPYDLKELKDIMRFVKTLENAATKGESKLSVQLSPENLGKLEIKLMEVGGRVTAKFFTDSETSHKMMLSQAEAIRTQLSEKGIVIDNMEFAFNDASTKDGKANDQRRTAKNFNMNKEDKDNSLERNNSLNFKARAQARGNLYA